MGREQTGSHREWAVPVLSGETSWEREAQLRAQQQGLQHVLLSTPISAACSSAKTATVMLGMLCVVFYERVVQIEKEREKIWICVVGRENCNCCWYWFIVYKALSHNCQLIRRPLSWIPSSLLPLLTLIFLLGHSFLFPLFSTNSWAAFPLDLTKKYSSIHLLSIQIYFG